MIPKFAPGPSSQFWRTSESGTLAVCLRSGERDEVQQALVDLSRVRQYQHVGERFALAKAAARLSSFEDVVKGMLTKREVQAQLLAGNAERGEHVRLANCN